jgi:hypothetical protein
MRVVDGTHRLQAAALRGESEILVRFFDGDDEDAFILAVEANITHGLPLSLADRTAAAARIVAARPDWSNRKIASVAGIAATTVGTIRQRSTAQSEQLNTSARVGRDGKARRLNVAEGRLRASELIKRRPEAPIREIAEAAGVSPATALDVRNRVREGEHPVPERQRPTRAGASMQQRGQAVSGNSRAGQASGLAWDVVLERLKNDPSLRFTDTGRSLLRWLDSQTVRLGQWKQYFENVPAHCAHAIIELVRHNCNTWGQIVEHLERQ